MAAGAFLRSIFARITASGVEILYFSPLSAYSPFTLRGLCGKTFFEYRVSIFERRETPVERRKINQKRRGVRVKIKFFENFYLLIT